MYSEFARVYDALMDDVDYAGWAEYYLDILSRAGVRPREAAECGCGTGSLSVELARRGVRLIASDLSEEMLMKAGDKARKRGVPVRFVRCDMRRLRLTRPVDAVICACDGVNYLLRDEDALSFFRAAYAALKPGGALAFDVSSEHKLRGMLRERMYGEDREDVTYLWTNEPGEGDTVEMELTFFLRDADGRYTRMDERQVQRIYTADTLMRLLKEAGFEGAAAYGGRTFDQPGDAEERIHFTARKAEI